MLNKKLIVILGMHRSGTSTFARALKVMGVDLGNNLLPAQKDVNEKGFWEDLDVNLLNEKILFSVSNSWHHLMPLSDEELAQIEKLGFFQEAINLLQQKVSSVEIFGLKDPRLPRLLPFWKRVFETLQLDVSYIIPLRHPLSVAQSLSRRDGFPIEKGLLMWLDHMVACLRETQGERRIVAIYDELVEHPESVLFALAEFLDLEIDSDELIIFKEEFLDRNLRHHVFLTQDFGAQNDKLLSMIDALYKELMLCHLNSARLDAISSRAISEWQDVMNHYRLFWRVINSMALQLNERDLRINQINQSLIASEAEINRLNVQINEYKRTLSEIYHSKSWQLITLLRTTRQLILPRNSWQEKMSKKIWFLLKSGFVFFRRILHVWREEGWRSLMAKFYRRLNLELDKRLFFTRKRLMGIIARYRRTPLVSVVIPIYDRTDVLIESIESILRQTYQNFELLLVCDGSPPETLEIVQHYAVKYPKKIRAFYFKNNSGNAVRGRNKAIKEAQGEYLAFQDSDDIAEPYRLEYSVKFIQESNADVIYGGWRALVDGSRHDIDIKNGQEFFSPDADFEMLKRICVPCQSTVMAKVSALRAVGGLNEQMRYREDHELWLRLAHRGYKFKSIPVVLTNLRLHQGNLEISLKKDDIFWEKRMLEEYPRERRLKPKIGYVVPGNGIGGGLIVVLEHANRLLKRGYDVTVISENNQTDLSWYPEQLVNVIPLKDVELNYDILVATGWSTAYPVAELPAIRKFYLVQSDERRFFQAGDPIISRVEKTYHMNFEFLTIARWMQKWLKEEFGKDTVYVPNAINEKIVHRTPALEPKGNKLRVLLEGPIDVFFKGMEDAFRAVDGVDCEVWCVSSSGKPKPTWRCDRFFGRVEWARMKHIYSSCDVLLKMSRVEGFFLPPLEMMACGGTSVVSEVTGIDEYIQHEYNALVVGQRDVIGARQALIRLSKDRNLLHFLSVNGQATAEKFRWEPSIDILEQIFNPPVE